MSRKKSRKVKNFLEQDGYLLVFTLICLLSLVTYFLANRYFLSNDQQVLDITSVKGVWVSTVGSNDCPEAELIDANGCIDNSYFDKYTELNTQRISIDDNGKVIFSNTDLFINGSFDTKEVVDSDVWDTVYIGDFTLKINERNWVFKDLVWKEGSNEYVLGITKVDNGYLISFFPSASLDTLQKQLWIFEYSDDTDSVSQLFFKKNGSSSVFIDSTYVSILEDEDDIFLRIDYLDPSLVDGREVILYEYVNNGLDFINNYVLKAD
ncbi:MAG: hypothetical protein PHP08_01185 [Candidatus Dojkabacteria bacterium]|nr:hypothetical protein [Candidatus Dojkabacteria bacterium]